MKGTPVGAGTIVETYIDIHSMHCYTQAVCTRALVTRGCGADCADARVCVYYI